MNLEGAFKSGDNCRYYSHSDSLTTPQLHSRYYNHTKATFKILQSHYRYYSHISGHNSEGLHQVLPGWSSIPSTIVSFFMLQPTEIGIFDREMWQDNAKILKIVPVISLLPVYASRISRLHSLHIAMFPSEVTDVSRWSFKSFPSTLFFLSWSSL